MLNLTDFIFERSVFNLYDDSKPYAFEKELEKWQKEYPQLIMPDRNKKIDSDRYFLGELYFDKILRDYVIKQAQLDPEGDFKLVNIYRSIYKEDVYDLFYQLTYGARKSLVKLSDYDGIEPDKSITDGDKNYLGKYYYMWNSDNKTFDVYQYTKYNKKDNSFESTLAGQCRYKKDAVRYVYIKNGWKLK